MPQSFVSLNCHIVFSTKYRKPWIQPDWADRLYQYLGGIARGCDASLLHAGGTSDHVHLLVSLGKTHAISDFLRQLKSNSSKWVHETFSNKEHFGWQVGYGAFSVSQSNLDVVRSYIANQAEHHRRMTFQEEFIALLKKHGLEFDERYLWE